MDIIITICPMNLRYRSIKVNTKMRIGEAKELFGIKDKNYSWRYCGIKLNDNNTFEDYGIEDQDEEIIETPKRAGGGFQGFGIET